MKLVVWLLILAGTAYGSAKLYLHHEVGEAMDMAVLMAAPFAGVEYRGVASTMTGELTIEGIRVRPNQYQDEIYIERMGIDTPSFLSLVEMSDFANLRPNSIPEYFGVILEGLRLPVDGEMYRDFYEMSRKAQNIAPAEDAASRCTGRGGFSPDALKALGYREQVFSMSMTARNDNGSYGFEVDASIDDMWEAEASLVLAGNMMSELSMGPAYRPKLRELQFEYVDRSLKGRVEAYCGQLGLSPEQTFLAQMETFQLMGELNGIVFDEYMLEPYREFLRGKSTFLITARPNEPVAMSQIDLYKPSDVPALLNLEGQAF